jgi:hypothetical protein
VRKLSVVFPLLVATGCGLLSGYDGLEVATAIPRTDGGEPSPLEVGPCACEPLQTCELGVCIEPPSCAAIHAAAPGLDSGEFDIDPDGSGPRTAFAVYCDMSSAGGGWTLAAKMDGGGSTWTYAATAWTDGDTFGTERVDLTPVEAKFRSFTEMPFTELRAMMVDGAPRALVVRVGAASLRALFLGTGVRTEAGRAAWLGLLASADLQGRCNAEGTNLTFGDGLRVRLGIVGNETDDCASPDSYVGFGAAFARAPFCFDTDPRVVVGNVAATKCGTSLDRVTKAFGLLWIR